uniref:C2H2-type domain-containing protein n=1 Tax=Glossina morsitans morsitans TaxID=37546 RepID=A0A1B0FQN4_GLOMM
MKDYNYTHKYKRKANKTRFVCTYPGCKLSENTKAKIERHIRMVHLSPKKPRRSTDQGDDYFIDSDSHEEEFYYTEIEDDDDDCKTPSPTSPPTLSHRDMARPPHEDPEYQRQIVGNFKPKSSKVTTAAMTTTTTTATENATLTLLSSTANINSVTVTTPTTTTAAATTNSSTALSITRPHTEFLINTTSTVPACTKNTTTNKRHANLRKHRFC